MHTAGALLQDAARRLEARGIASPRLDAELLLAEVMGIERSSLLAREESMVDPAQCERFEAWIGRRLDQVPVAYILGRREFWSLELHVDEAVLVPRPETELVVETALAEMRRKEPGGAPPVIVDVGTGAGPIILALASELPAADLHATEISGPALAVARRNADRHGLGGRIRFHQGDLLTPLLEAGMAGRVDMVVSNPPYIALDEEVDAGVRRWEPAGALYSGPAGHETIERLIGQSVSLLPPEGCLIMEISPERVAFLERTMNGSEAWSSFEILPDLAGKPRVLMARRAGAVR